MCKKGSPAYLRMIQRLNVKAQQHWDEHIVKMSRQSDRTAGRESLRGVYIDAAWVRDTLETLNGRCAYCGCEMKYGLGVNRTTDRDGLTVQRICNERAHTQDNCTLACRGCNTVGIGAPHATMLIYGPELKGRSHKYCPFVGHAGLRVVPITEFYARKTHKGYTAYCKRCSTTRKRQRE
jgi:hypothetical protein